MAEADKTKRATFKRQDVLALTRLLDKHGTFTAGIFSYETGYSDEALGATLTKQLKKEVSAADVKRFRLSVKMKLSDEGRTSKESIDTLLRVQGELNRRLAELAQRVADLEASATEPPRPKLHMPQEQPRPGNGAVSHPSSRTMHYANNGGSR